MAGQHGQRPFMARQGQVRYKVAAGRPLYGGTHNNSTVSPDFLLGRPREHLTTRRCMAASLPPPATTSPRRSGSARIWGCWALCLRTSPAQMRGCRMGRSSPVTATVSTMPKRLIKPAVPAFVGYRFSDRHFLSMPEYLQRRATDGGDAWHEKQSYTVTYSQSVPVLNMSAALSVSRLNYWNAQSNNNYMLSFNKVFSLGELQGSRPRCRCP